MKLSNKVYDILNYLIKLIPLLVALIGAICSAIGIGEGITNSILMILGAIGTFLNGLLEISKQYFNANNTITITSKEEK